MSSLNRKPTPNTIAASPVASWRICASRSAPSPLSSVVNWIPSSFCSRSSPAYAASLNDLSPRPPMSNTRPTWSGFAAPCGVVWACCSAFLPHPTSASGARTATASATRARRRRILGIGSSPLSCDLRYSNAASELMAAPAARLVDVGAADAHATATTHLAVGSVRRITAHDADRERFRDELGDREQLRHRLERLACVVLIESRDDHALAAVRERLAHS